jgi:hypothetical protein
VAAAVRAAEHLGRGQQVRGPGSGRAFTRRGDRERLVLHDQQVVDLLEVVVGAEPEGVDLALGRRVDPAPLIARERPLLVVGRDDVLAQLRADAL